MKQKKTDPFYWTNTFCRHWRQGVAVGRFTVSCSSGILLQPERNAEPYPDFGIYLAPVWENIVGGKIWTNGSALKKAAELRHYPALVVDWLDMSAPAPELLSRLVDICLSKMRQGKRIDIGCNAGHGRTGTLLAALIARVEHVDGYTAMQSARRRYCKSAVEGRSQEEAVIKYTESWRWKRR